VKSGQRILVCLFGESGERGERRKERVKGIVEWKFNIGERGGRQL